MLRVQSNTDLKQLIQPQGIQQAGQGAPGGPGFTEFEEDIHFDDNDPDFDHLMPSFIVQVATKMSLASVYPSSEVHSSHSSLATLSHSLDDIQTWSSNHHLAAAQVQLQPQQYHQHEPVITIEQLRAQMSSCFTCGVSWPEQQVSLDCAECGGYALQRPCPECEGVCGAPEWKRDITMSHECSKAKWQGTCNLNQKSSPLIAQELCSRLEKLSATTQT